MTFRVQRHRALRGPGRHAPPGTKWCPHHGGGKGEFVALEEFGRGQRYCRACRANYMKSWRRGEVPPSDAVAEGFERLAAKYANR